MMSDEKKRKLILAIDFNNILFSSYYSSKLINSKGINVNAIKGFFFRIKSLKESLDPDYIVLANDISRERTFRRKLYKKYKANRKTHDDDIMTQMKFASQIAELIGFPFINNDLYEADDVMGMLGKFAEDNDMNLIIVSSDKDLYQLVSDHTFILSPKNSQMIDPSFMEYEYKLTPAQWIDYKMLVGDTGDNIPGVPGVGPIGALKLLHEFGNIETIYQNLSNLKPGLRANLQSTEPMLPLIRQLVTILTDYSLIELTEEMMEMKPAYPEELFRVISELEIHTLINVMRYSLLVEKPKEYVGPTQIT